MLIIILFIRTWVLDGIYSLLNFCSPVAFLLKLFENSRFLLSGFLYWLLQAFKSPQTYVLKKFLEVKAIIQNRLLNYSVIQHRILSKIKKGNTSVLPKQSILITPNQRIQKSITNPSHFILTILRNPPILPKQNVHLIKRTFEIICKLVLKNGTKSSYFYYSYFL